MNVHPSSTVICPGADDHRAIRAERDVRDQDRHERRHRPRHRVPGCAFQSRRGAPQVATLRRVEGALAAGTGEDGQVVVEGAPVSIGRDARVTQAGDYRFFAGWRSDPFFFDTLGALDNLRFTGADFFVDKNVCGIVIEAPNAAFGSGAIGLWARTLVNGAGGWAQAERGARPQQGVFCPARRRRRTPRASR